MRAQTPGDLSKQKYTFSTVALFSAGITLLGGMVVGTILLVSRARGSNVATIVGAGLVLIQALVAFLLWQTNRKLRASMFRASAQSSALNRALQEQERLQSELSRRIAEQKRLNDLLDTFSTPVTSITQGVIAIPLVGIVDRKRIAHIRASLLHGIEQHRAKAAIIDLTGMAEIAPETLQQFTQVISAAELMGCRVVVTGIHAQTARDLLIRKLDLNAKTCRDLHAGIVYATELVTGKQDSETPDQSLYV
jgi:anti-anti-sigma regulatory factor